MLGSMEWAKTLQRGEFFCPLCNTAKSFQRKVSRPFLTLYFIPVIPIGGLREYVLCRGCRQRFDPDILEQESLAETIKSVRRSSRNQSFEQELVRLMALTIMEDNFANELEIEMAQRVYRSMTGERLDESQLNQACHEVMALRINASRYVGVAGSAMTYDQKLLALQAMFAVASSEGEISPKRMQTLIEAQQQLGLDQVAFQSAIKEAADWVA